MADAYQLQSNGDPLSKPLLELYVKASGIDARRIGADLFCQEFWMELYALYEIGVARVEVKTVNVNSEAFKKNFLGAQPPIMIEEEKEITYTDNREIEGRIFHLAKEYNVPLFEKDPSVEKRIENLYRVSCFCELAVQFRISEFQAFPQGQSGVRQREEDSICCSRLASSN